MMASRQERDAGQLRLLSALNAPSYCRWHGHTLGLPWLWARVCHLCWGWEPHCWILRRWRTNRTSSLKVLGCKAGDRRQQMDTGSRGSMSWCWEVFNNVAGSHPTHPATLGSQAGARGEKGLGNSWGGFGLGLLTQQMWQPSRDVSHQVPSCHSSSSLPHLEKCWGGGMSLGFVCSYSNTVVIPERLCFAGVSSHSVHLCSPSPLPLGSQDLQMRAGKTGSWQCVREAASTAGESALLHFCPVRWPTSAATRVSLFIFHLLVRVRIMRVTRRDVCLGSSVTSFAHQACGSCGSPEDALTAARWEKHWGGSGESTSGAAADYGQ